MQRVERAGVVDVAVRQHDPRDRLAEPLRGGDQCVRAAAHERVDERQPVVLAHEVGVDGTEAR
ncbi:hypothetical protein Q5424_12500 [Conexibacter sp. JD483]|nr:MULTISPECIES: hypothetical protein [unclassified Conexibacter]MDO8185767.1 hypothetical protein [Conexibacter sp. CPCC 205706]MDO8199144.1 hypothetical protein [Conexibacter sp. CPCC 205762]MDR9369911.1 hypothetical protein [Conexibacter sp. JD483]